MAKPIFLMRIENKDGLDYEKTVKTIGERLSDEYHVLIIVEEDFPEGIKCECFNAEKITPIEIEELKKIINNKNHGN